MFPLPGLELASARSGARTGVSAPGARPEVGFRRLMESMCAPMMVRGPSVVPSMCATMLYCVQLCVNLETVTPEWPEAIWIESGG